MQFAMLFPGQGSQSVGMLGELAREFPVVRETFDEASDALGIDLWRLSREGPAEELNLTEHTQPALLAAGVAVWRAWRAEGGGQPHLMAGHSLGEYTALTCAGALDYGEALHLVQTRGRLMQAAAESEGGMAAIVGLSDAEVLELCRVAGEGDVLEAVNFNAPGQVVIAGTRAAVERGIAQAKVTGARLVRPVAISVPAHSSLMEPAAQRLREALEAASLRVPEVPVVHNLDAQTRSRPEDIRAALVAQLHNPVLWVDSVRRLLAEGANPMFECGPGKVLTGLNRRIDKSIQAAALADATALRQAVERTQQD